MGEQALPSLSAQNVSYLLWSRVYRNSSLPRPPGPLALAELNSHIMTLKQSACLQRTWAEVRAKEASPLSMWTHSAMKASEPQFGRKRTLDLSFKDSREGKFAVVFSRWLFVAIPREDCVVCHDLNAPNDDLGKFTKVYKSQEADILHFACAESTGLNGQPIAFAAVKERRRSSSHTHSSVMFVVRDSFRFSCTHRPLQKDSESRSADFFLSWGRHANTAQGSSREHHGLVQLYFHDNS
ncbi:hypothetical protein BDN67DRAFT_166633 [Paxillus ammoniavirescens]|nr:hypothetical protein BDN67DRAFT_166633 [Paxillus ammoniavirescens]